MAAGNPPVLVTGAHRSGTTWVGSMLGLSPRITVVHEPFSPISDRGTCAYPFSRFFEYVCDENGAGYEPALRDTVELRYRVGAGLRGIRSPGAAAAVARNWRAFAAGRRSGARALLKDPIAVFSAPWIASRFGAQVVLLVRHPAAFASSLARLGWTHDFATFLAQPLLVRDHLGPFEREIREQVAHPGTPLEQAVLLWRVIYTPALGEAAKRPDWIVRRHEDLSLDPAGTFEGLYASLGLDFDEGVRAAVLEASAADNPQELRDKHDVRMDSAAAVRNWERRLTPEEIARVREGTADVAADLYGPTDW